MTECHSCGGEFERVGQHYARGDCSFPDISEHDMQILRGLLLGDGYVTRRDTDSPRFSIDNTNKEFLQWLSKELDVPTNGVRVVKEDIDSDDSKLDRLSDDPSFADQYRLDVICHPQLTELASWYDDGDKQIPSDIDATPTVIKYWYVSDGSLDGAAMSFACCNYADQQKAVESLFASCGVDSSDLTWSVTDHSTAVTVLTDAAADLFNVMGRPPKGFHYKWPEGVDVKDEHGEYKTDAGSSHPVDADEVGYEPCNAVLKYTFERYGERRYCTAMAVSNFGDAANYEYPQTCRSHQVRSALMEDHARKHTTGAHATSHKHVFEYMPSHKKLMANDLYASLLEESTYDFETETTELSIDVTESDFVEDVDELILDHEVPTAHRIRGKALWHAALDFVTMESIKEEQFRVSAEESHDGRSLAVGETTTVVSVTDDGREITDTDEHHLNLPLSRMTKHYKEHMKFGGVEYDTDDDQAAMGTREWVAVVEPDEPEPAPEATSGETVPTAEIEIPSDGDMDEAADGS